MDILCVYTLAANTVNPPIVWWVRIALYGNRAKRNSDLTIQARQIRSVLYGNLGISTNHIICSALYEGQDKIYKFFLLN